MDLIHLHSTCTVRIFVSMGPILPDKTTSSDQKTSSFCVGAPHQGVMFSGHSWVSCSIWKPIKKASTIIFNDLPPPPPLVNSCKIAAGRPFVDNIQLYLSLYIPASCGPVLTVLVFLCLVPCLCLSSCRYENIPMRSLAGGKIPAFSLAASQEQRKMPWQSSLIVRFLSFLNTDIVSRNFTFLDAERLVFGCCNIV